MGDLSVPIRECPGSNVTDIPQRWYQLPSAPNFDICSRCYTDHLKDSPFASKFQYEDGTSGIARCCDFNVPRGHAVLRQALERNSFAGLRDYMMRRCRMPKCKGDATVKAEDGFAWFQLADPNLAGKFGVCSACYEDYLVAAGFAPHFVDTPITQPDGQLWECDVGKKLCRKLLINDCKWDQLLGWGLYLKQLPKCGTANEVDSASRQWFQLRDPDFETLCVCEACYYDVIYGGIAAQHFHESPSNLPPGIQLTCFAGGSVPLRVALNQAVDKDDWDIFYRAAQVLVRSPPCRAEGIENGVWYSLIPSCDEFDVCAACYACLFEAMGIGHYLAPKSKYGATTAEARRCDMNLSSPHAQKLYNRIDLAMALDDASIFTNFARRIVSVLPCPRDGPVAGRRWYTHDAFTCCPSCWIQAPIEGTALSGCFSDEIEVEGTLNCDFYSPRVRQLWTTACAEDDLAGFAAFMKQRLEIWKQTYPKMQQNLALMRINNQRQQTLFQVSLMNQGTNNIAAAAGVTNGHYGNGQIGYNYETWVGAQGAIQFNQAMSMSGQNSGLIAEIAQLEGIWKSVE